MVGNLPGNVETLAGMHFSAATAAFQIEGARSADGRGRSMWDDFVDTPGNIIDGSTAEPGPDSCHRLDDDVAMLADLSVDRYRFSISWARVIPNAGTDASVNSAGLDYDDRLVDGLLAGGITPEPTDADCAPVTCRAAGSAAGVTGAGRVSRSDGSWLRPARGAFRSSTVPGPYMRTDRSSRDDVCRTRASRLRRRHGVREYRRSSSP